MVTQPGEEIFDFGTLLSKGQVLHHVFSLSNPGEQNLQILSAEAVVPCCSAIESAPKSIAPGGTGQLCVVFSAGRQKGRKKVGFLVTTDSPTNPVRRFLLIANFLHEYEVRTMEGSDTVVPLGREGRQRLSLMTRRLGDDGLEAPASIDGSGALSASFDGSVRENSSDGLTETERVIRVRLSPLKEVGTHEGTLSFDWPDGQEREFVVQWKVEPWITATPPGFVLNREDGPLARSVVLNSRDRPFRVLKVTGPVDRGIENDFQESTSVHRIQLKIVPDKAGTVSDIRIETDLPEQPIVVLSVLMMK